MAIYIHLIKIVSITFWTNKLITVVRVQYSIDPLCPDQLGPLCRMAKLKINVAQGTVILEFAIILIGQCRDKQWQHAISVKRRLVIFECEKL